MDDLVGWLGAQLDEDERIARAATPGPWSIDNDEYAEAIYGTDLRTTVVAGGRWGGEASVFESTEDALHIAEHDPARVLREIDRKRGIVARYEFACKQAAELGLSEVERETRVQVAGALQSCVLLLAGVYSHRSGYAEALAAFE